jgi:hypothetical protein
MAMKLKCPSCNTDSEMGFGGNYEPRGKDSGFAIYKCVHCGAGLRIKNAGRAMITKRAKAEQIPANTWTAMSAQWDATFPK